MFETLLIFIPLAGRAVSSFGERECAIIIMVWWAYVLESDGPQFKYIFISFTHCIIFGASHLTLNLGFLICKWGA